MKFQTVCLFLAGLIFSVANGLVALEKPANQTLPDKDVGKRYFDLFKCFSGGSFDLQNCFQSKWKRRKILEG